MAHSKRPPNTAPNSKLARREANKQGLLSLAYAKGSPEQRDAKARAYKLAGCHLGNKLTKPHGLWNPNNKKPCMSRLRSGQAPNPS